MDELMRNVWLLASESCRDGLVALLALAVVAPWAGSLLLARRLPLVAFAVPHLAGCGVALAFLVAPMILPLVDADGFLQEPPRWSQQAGAGISVLLGLVLLSVASRGRPAPGAAAVLLLAAMALTEILYREGPYQEIPGGSVGHLITMEAGGRDAVLIACLASLAVVIVFRRSLHRAAFDSELHRLMGHSPVGALLLSLLPAAATCTISVPELSMGPVLALLLGAPAILRSSVPSLRSFGPLSAVAGGVGSVAGFVLAIARDWPFGPAITGGVLSVSALLALVLRFVVRR